NVVAVDSDVDITDDAQVLWAIATHFQPHRDLFVVDGLPGSPLDPSSSADGTTSRMGVDATRGAHAVEARARVGDAAMQRAAHLVAQLAGAPR
ncbi:UbiD family decarboxylase, partial [Burkholderia cenocepacia]